MPIVEPQRLPNLAGLTSLQVDVLKIALYLERLYQSGFVSWTCAIVGLSHYETHC
jgi:hypothetical protein